MSVASWLLTGLLVVAGGLCVWGYLTGGPGPVRTQAPTWQQEKARRAARRRGEVTQRLRSQPLHPEPDEEWTPPWERPAGTAEMPPEWPLRRGK